ncbi:MAG: helix-turn-helix domain-containing protein [Deltaproteobacteria bacterium]|nr:helix-turn-helix domain-containing protein [Deltaproteobacteria bacterium]
MTEQKFMSTKEAATYLGLPSPAALRMAIHRGHIQPTARLGRRLLFSQLDLDEQLADRMLQQRPVLSSSASLNQEEIYEEENRNQDRASRCAATRQERIPDPGVDALPEDGTTNRTRKENDGHPHQRRSQGENRSYGRAQRSTRTRKPRRRQSESSAPVAKSESDVWGLRAALVRSCPADGA